MTVYAWPSWKVNAFQLRLIPNLRTFVGPYTPTVQVVDLLGERWTATLQLVASNDSIQIAAQEAYFDRLKGTAHQIALPHLRLHAPQGTLRGSPTLSAAVAQLANVLPIQTTAGATLRAGDMLGCGGQLFRVMADATANGSGLISAEVQGRARTALSSGAAVTWSAPTANFMMKSPDGVPTVWQPGSITDAISVDLIEVW
jgi:hypothetical protein